MWSVYPVVTEKEYNSSPPVLPMGIEKDKGYSMI